MSGLLRLEKRPTNLYGPSTPPNRFEDKTESVFDSFPSQARHGTRTDIGSIWSQICTGVDVKRQVAKTNCVKYVEGGIWTKATASASGMFQDVSSRSSE